MINENNNSQETRISAGKISKLMSEYKKRQELLDDFGLQDTIVPQDIDDGIKAGEYLKAILKKRAEEEAAYREALAPYLEKAKNYVATRPYTNTKFLDAYKERAIKEYDRVQKEREDQYLDDTRPRPFVDTDDLRTAFRETGSVQDIMSHYNEPSIFSTALLEAAYNDPEYIAVNDMYDDKIRWYNSPITAPDVFGINPIVSSYERERNERLEPVLNRVYQEKIAPVLENHIKDKFKITSDAEYVMKSLLNNSLLASSARGPFSNSDDVYRDSALQEYTPSKSAKWAARVLPYVADAPLALVGTGSAGKALALDAAATVGGLLGYHVEDKTGNLWAPAIGAITAGVLAGDLKNVAKMYRKGMTSVAAPFRHYDELLHGKSTAHFALDGHGKVKHLGTWYGNSGYKDFWTKLGAYPRASSIFMHDPVSTSYDYGKLLAK